MLFIFLLVLSLKGGAPVSSSKRSIPIPHKSTSLVCPFLSITSGAMYSGVPANVLDLSEGFWKSLLSPKSVILMWPSSPTKIFSGFMSLYLICTSSCKNWIPNITSANINLAIESSKGSCTLSGLWRDGRCWEELFFRVLCFQSVYLDWLFFFIIFITYYVFSDYYFSDPSDSFF